MSSNPTDALAPLNLALLTVSDTRGPDEDTSGQYLENQLVATGHQLAARRLLPDDVYLVRALLSRWIADPTIHGIIITGGTGFHERDSTPEAVAPLLDKTIDGFGEEFRRLSQLDIGTSTIQSRAFATAPSCGSARSASACAIDPPRVQVEIVRTSSTSSSPWAPGGKNHTKAQVSSNHSSGFLMWPRNCIARNAGWESWG